MGVYEITLIFLSNLLRYLTVIEENLTPEDRARRERWLAIGDKVLADFEKLQPKAKAEPGK